MAAKKKSNKPSISKEQPINYKPSISKEPPINYNAKWADAMATVRKADEEKRASQARAAKSLKAYDKAMIVEENDRMVRATKIKDVGKGGVSHTEKSNGSSVMRNLFRFGGGGPLNRGK